MTEALVALGVAWLAGAVFVSASWPSREPLPFLGLLGLAGVLGPLIAGSLLALASVAGLSPSRARWLIAAAVVGASVIMAGRSRTQVRRAEVGLLLAMALAVLVVGTTALSLRTHLGWDGTVVWYHKARMIAATGGHMPARAMTDATRIWTAPDYPLHVPQSMAWVRVWQPVEDERVIKLLPALWCAALLMVVGASVLDRARGRRDAQWRAAAAVLLVVTTVRLVVGEGSLTSGYADGVLAACSTALLWIAWRSAWGRDPRWHPLMAALAVAAAWTKQEGIGVVLAVTAVSLCRHGRHAWPAVRFAVPACVLAVLWAGYCAWVDAPTTMAYAWPGLRALASRAPSIAQAYLTEAVNLSQWGLFWPAMAVLITRCGDPRSRDEVLALSVVVAAGAAAFLLSGWGDVRAHLAVTVPRQLIQVAPALIAVTVASAAVPKSR